MKIPQILAVLAIAACSKGGPKQDTFPQRQLGESTASPGDNASKPAPVTPDDPRVMNVSAGITPAQQQRAVQAPTVAPAPTPAPSSTSATTNRAPSTPDPATSSTPVTPPTDIAPPSTTTEANRPGVFSPPPPPPQ